jgi:hypothetical protein
MRLTVLLFALPLLCSCADKEKKDNADSVAGPVVDVHCFGALPNRGVGDTNTRVNCPTGFPP